MAFDHQIEQQHQRVFMSNNLEHILSNDRFKYSLSETSKSVETVSGFEFTIMVSMPSS